MRQLRAVEPVVKIGRPRHDLLVVHAASGSAQHGLSCRLTKYPAC
jgi:hypothetical protein